MGGECELSRIGGMETRGEEKMEVNERIKKLTCRWGCTAKFRFPKNVKIQNVPPSLPKNVKYNNRRYLTIKKW